MALKHIEDKGDGILRMVHEYFYMDYKKINGVWHWEDDTWSSGRRWLNNVCQASIDTLEQWEKDQNSITSLY